MINSDQSKKYLQAQLDSLIESVPYARKSFNAFKPLLINKIGGIQKTEVLGRADHIMVEGKRFRVNQRGIIFETRQDAIDFAEQVRQQRISQCLESAKKYGIFLSSPIA